MLINLLGQCADYGTFFLIGILSFLYHPLQLDIRWTFLVLFILHISRYTAMATMLDIVQWKRKKPLLKNTSEDLSRQCISASGNAARRGVDRHNGCSNYFLYPITLSLGLGG